MKKIVFYILFIFLFSIGIVYANSNFSIKTEKIVDNNLNKNSFIVKTFADKLSFYFEPLKVDDEEQELTLLSNKITYLLLGSNENETAEDYFNRYKTYLNMIYSSEKITSSNKEYINLTTNFKNLEQLNIEYDNIDSIKINKINDEYLSMVTIKNITFIEDNIKKVSDLNLYYYFKKQDNEYKLSYVTYETSLEVLDYLYELMENKIDNNTVSPYNSKLKEMEEFKNKTNIDDKISNDIISTNLNNIVILNSYYNGSLIKQANGFFITKDLLITTWSFLENSLINAQDIIITNMKGLIYEDYGIVKIIPDKNIVIIKLNNVNNSFGTIDDNLKPNLKDETLILTSLNGSDLIAIPSFISSIDENINLLNPVALNSEGSPVFNSKGKIIGMITSDIVNSSLSSAIPVQVLKEIHTKISSADLSTTTFKELKNKYYYTTISEENIKNNIPSKKWTQYSKIGDVENAIKLKLVKANYTDEIISLRYYNDSFKYINSIQFANKFIENLKAEEYIETFKDDNKYVYENLNYKIIIFGDYEYLFVVMVKK